MRMHALGLAALLSFGSMAVRAEAPLNTVEAETLQPGACRFDAGLGQVRFKFAGSKFHSNLFSAGIACGLNRSMEWDLGGYHVDNEGDDYQTLMLGGKLRLIGQHGDASQLSLRAGTSVTRASGAGDSDSSWDGLGLALAFSQIVGAGHRIDLNLGTHTKAGAWEHANWSVAYTHRLGAQWDLVGEIQGAVHFKPNQSLGLRWKPEQNWEFGALVTRYGMPDQYQSKATKYLATARWKF